MSYFDEDDLPLRDEEEENIRKAKGKKGKKIDDSSSDEEEDSEASDAEEDREEEEEEDISEADGEDAEEEEQSEAGEEEEDAEEEEEEEDAEEEESDADAEEDEEEGQRGGKRKIKIPAKKIYKKSVIEEEDNGGDEDEDEEGETSETYLQKFGNNMNDDYLLSSHPECIVQNYHEILAMTYVVRNQYGIIVDNLHRTIPYLTKYEKARCLGQRTMQLNAGATPFVKTPETILDGYIIAELELKEKKIPFIIRRPLPNGGSEYWKLQDLEDVI